MNKLGKVAVALAMAFSVGAATAEADEPDYYLEWLGSQSDPKQEIDTGVVFTNQPRVVATMCKMNSADCDQMGTKSAWFNINYSTGQLWYRYASTVSSATINNITPSVQGRWIDGEWSTKIIHDGVQIGSVNKAFTGNGESFLLFRGRSYSYVRFKSVDLYEGEELVRSFRPAVKNGIAGMWDSVTQKIYPNTGSGKFETGPVFSDPTKVTVAGFPANYGTVDPAYGPLKGLAAGETVPVSAPDKPFVEGGLTLTCTGWKLYSWNSDTGVWDFLREGPETSFDYVHPDPAIEMKLEWQWAKSGVDTRAFGPGTITMKLEDGVYTFTAVPSDGARFVRWYVGDALPLAEVANAEISLSPEAAKGGVRAYFVSLSGEKAPKTWTGDSGTGKWGDDGNWDPSGVPTLDDAVTIPMGRVTIDDFAVAGSLALGAAAELYLGSEFTDSSAIYAIQGDFDGAPKCRGIVVDGDIVVSGALTLGGRVTDKAETLITNLCLKVGGDVTVRDAGKLTVYAAPCQDETMTAAGLYAAATVMDIGGAFAIRDKAVLYPSSDELTGAPVKFCAASFTLDETASVDANNRGWHYFTNAGTVDKRPRKTPDRRDFSTMAFGLGNNSSVGSGHGGLGGGATEGGSFGQTYGYAYAPFLPGAPGGGDNGFKKSYTPVDGAVRGGGCFWLRTTGPATVNGTIKASPNNTAWDAASGGSVWLAVGELTVGEKASITAKGADKGGSGGANCAGGGGRVSLAIGLSDEQLDTLAAGGMPEGIAASETITLIPVNVFGGTTSTGRAGDGTATTVVVKDESAVNITVVSATPVAVTGTDPQYGTWPLADRTAHAFTAPVYGKHPENTSWRYKCLGYVVSNATAEVQAGTETTFTFTPDGEDVTVYWRWDEREFGIEVAKPVNGKIRANGTLMDDAGWVWTREGASCVLEAVPDAGCEFLNWTGEVADFDDFTAAEIRVDSSAQRVVAPFFRVQAAATDYEWKGGDGSWADATQWTPENVPGPSDRVTIGSGTCTIDDYAAVAALTVSGGTLKTVPTAVSGKRERVQVVVSGDVTVSGEGKFTFGATDGGNTVWNWLEVGGDLTLDDTAEFLFSAGKRATPYTIQTGSGFVNVGGDFTIGGQSVFRPNCSGQTGGASAVTVGGRFVVAAGAKVDADKRGFGVFANVSPNTGVGDMGNSAAGHGGRGQGQLQDEKGEGGATYDTVYAPVWPGQQNRESGTASLVRGGGVVRVKAGAIRVDGTVTANGGTCGGGSASGGTIWLVGETVSLGAEAVLSATGAYISGMGSSTPPLPYGASGGGRIAIGIGLNEAKYAALLADGNALPKRVHDVTEAYLAAHPTATITAASGVNGVAENVEACQGTVKVVRGNYGLMLIVR